MKYQHGSRMAWRVARWLFALLALHLSPARADDAGGPTNGFPYEAYICVDEADVVAGPGARYYVTLRLPRGTLVEVYSEEASGWLAIRPPEGSFSWVPADYVDRHPDRPEVGRVKAPVGSWIGTSVERVAQHRQQVTLQSGELIRILGEKRVQGPDGEEQTWLKIAPPSGEFRWIHVRDVRRGKPPAVEPSPDPSATRPDDGEDVLDSHGGGPPPATELAVAHARLAADSARSSKVRTLGSAIPLHDLQDAAQSPIQTVAFGRHDTAETGTSPDGFVPRRRRPSSEDGKLSADDSASGGVVHVPRRLEGSASVGKSLAPSGSEGDAQRLAAASRLPLRDDGASRTRAAHGPAAEAAINAEEVARRLEQLEVDLALMLAQDRSQWNLAALRDQAMVLVERGADPAWRGRARMFVDRIEEIADAFQRGLPSRPLISTSVGMPGEVAPAARRTVEEVRYDAQGWLKEVVSRQANRPPAPYAVVDAQGRPVCFVSPTPGLNLHRYLNRQVGLFGRRGWLAELQKPHLVAERVVELDR
jgi:hypothetical protein